jgi:hypothetical protein
MWLQDVLSSLTVKRQRGNVWDCKCPAHEDDVASLQVSSGADGRVLLHCKAGCDFFSIVTAMGYRPSDMFGDDRGMSVELTPTDASVGVPVATYVYHDAEGGALFRVVKYDLGGGKKRFSQHKAMGNDAWASNMDGATRTLYRLPAVLDAAKHGRRVLYVEGEKDVETLERLGLVATTHPGGAGAWKSEYAKNLEGAEVVILPDNDAPGKKMAAAVMADVRGARVVELPNLPDKGDVSDWMAMGGTKEKLLKLLGPEMADMAPVRWIDFQSEREESVYYCGDVLLEETVNILVADGGVGKTTLVTQLCLALASGTPFLGFNVPEPISVLLLEAEGARSLYRARSGKAAKTLGIKDYYVNQRWAIQSRWMSDFSAGSMMVEDQIRKSGAKVVVMDTLGYFLGDGDENSSKDWKQKIMFPLTRLKAMYGCAFILLHHEGKPGEYRTGHHKGRGTSAMFGDCDTWISMQRLQLSESDREKLERLSPAERMEARDERLLVWEKSKVGPLPEPMTLHLDVENAVLSPKTYSIQERLDALPGIRKAKREDF